MTTSGWPIVYRLGVPIVLLVIGIWLLIGFDDADEESISNPAQDFMASDCEVRAVSPAVELNVRAAPNLEASVIRTLVSGSQIRVHGDIRDGYRRLYDGGWALDDYLDGTNGSC